MAAELHTTAAARLRRDGQRYTRNRQTLVEALEGAGAPMTIPEILERCPGVPQSSAYRNLAVLEGAGVVHRIVTTDEFSRFELAEELTEHHHHHLVCSGCGAVEDFSFAPALERRLEAALGAVAGDTGFAVDHHRLDLVGTCSGCRRGAAGQAG